MEYSNQENQFEPYHDRPDSLQNPRETGNGNSSFATASLVMGILALLSVCCFPPLTFFLGGLGIIFSCLSKGKTSRPGTAKAGLALSVGVLSVLTALFLIGFVVLTSTEKGSSLLQDYFELLFSQEEITSQEIYEFLDKYLDDGDSSITPDQSVPEMIPDYGDIWGDDFNDPYYQQDPYNPDWGGLPYDSPTPQENENPLNDFI